MTDTQAKNIYFLGIGGIGMSAIARYYLLEGVRVGGYDRTETALTRALASEGADIHYEDDPARIAAPFRNPDDTLVVHTPAIPHDHAETAWFRSRGFRMLKRSEILGVLAADKYVMAVAGTHGKTTTTTLTAWLNHVAGGGGSAFLGGISKNFDSNFVHGPGRRLAVEADEFDRSFLQLWPDAAVITSADADHLDIYGTHEELRRTFARFAGQIKPGGTLIIKQGVELPIANRDIRTYTYTCDAEADFHATGLEVQPDGTYRFDIVCPDRTIPDCRLGIPGRVNVENAVAAVALLWVAGFDEAKAPRGTRNLPGREASLRLPHQYAGTHLHGRLRPPPRRVARGTLLRTGHVPRTKDNGRFPTAPLYTHTGFPSRFRPGALTGGRGAARPHLSGP